MGALNLLNRMNYHYVVIVQLLLITTLRASHVLFPMVPV
jgi:hypothetical protein